jgi:sarcosine oxidase subunit alpha
VTRLPSGGRIDRDDVRSFTFDGQEYNGFGGDTVASALLAAGVSTVGASIYRGRPRGILTAGSTEPNAFAQVERWPSGGVAEPMLPLTTLELADGLELSTLSGIGRLDPGPDPSSYDKKYVYADVLVVGGGAAGLAAAEAGSADGSRVILVEQGPEVGGGLLDRAGGPGEEFAALVTRLTSRPEVRILTRAQAFGFFDHNYVLILERRTDHLPGSPRPGVSRQRVWHVRAGRVVLATGAHERPLVFENNDRPGVMLASAVQTYLHRYAVLPPGAGHGAVVATTGDSAYATALDLAAAGVAVRAVADSRAQPPPDLADRLAQAGIELIPGACVTGTSADGAGRLTAVRVSAVDSAGGSGVERWLDAGLLAVSGGWSPDLHLWSQARGATRWDEQRAAVVPGAAHPAQAAVECVGAAAGEVWLDGRSREHVRDPLPVWLAPGSSGEPGSWTEHFVDLHRDATVADVWRATGTGMRSLEHVKRYTTIGTGRDQGATAWVNAAALVAEALNEPGELGGVSFRAPSQPVAFAALAGREVGPLADPVRTTPIHSWHVAHGAVFENVGQWKRPWYYPQPGESMDDAVLRECRSARTGVAMMDASTLGTIEVIGPDAGQFLNRIYTNAFAKLAAGSARYGLMCTPDGMLMDDGVTMRLAPDRFLLSTTTGNAAKVLDWLEEWSQTEWPELAVTFTSVTEQWSTVAVVGPRSRDVVAQLAPRVDVSAETFAFMTFHETELAIGAAAVPGLISRISFSGELAFELKVPGWYGLALWEAVAEAGRPHGITPYGTETMHVLRAEKGYPIIGQDTDGTVTPDDLGMGWALSKAKDFIGKRSYSRADARRTGRRQLVGLLPVDHGTLLPEGAQLVEPGTPITPADGPVPMIGFVTSSYRSAALERTFALALVADGRNRLGQSVIAPIGDQLIEAVVTDSVLYDPEGARRDG